jgi:Flp pilus assembly protein TadD
MMRGVSRVRLLFACAGALTFAAPALAAADGQPLYGYGYAQAESPASALANYLRTLASDPKNFGALIGAGKAAIAIGDAQAAAGFFARADEVNPRSPLPQAGMGAVSVANGEPQAAMPYFTRALKLGAAPSQIGCDRGLAYDLLGQQSKAQADYRLALNGPDSDEARRRLALSLAISGDKAGAIEVLAPLSAKGDAATGRVRAFVLALTGDANGAMRAADAAMPGSWSSVVSFLQRLAGLRPDQKAAAVNLGIFPDPGDPVLASVPSYTAPTTLVLNANGDPVPPAVQVSRPQAPTSAFAAPIQVAYAAPVQKQQIERPQEAKPTASRKIWLQLASGPNADALPDQFHRLKDRNRDLFDGISGYVARGPDRARLVIGPFRGSSDAEIFQEDLQSVGIDAFSWTNSESDKIVPLGTE